MSIDMSFDKRNKPTMKEEIDSIVSSISQSQLAATNNAIDINKEAQNQSPKSFAKSRGTNLTLNEPFIKHDTEPQLLGENARFSRAVKPIQIEDD
jgi:hypothetical protein